MNPSVSIIVLSYNGRDLTLACIRSLLSLTYSNYQILVVDNLSSDDSVAAIQKEFRGEIGAGRVRLIVNQQNLGFAGGNNVGIAASSDFDYVLLLNNDTIVAKDFLEHMMNEMGRLPQAGICGPMIYYFEPDDQIWFAGTEVFLHRGISRHRGIRQRDNGQFAQPEIVDAVTGCAMLIRRDVLTRIGGLDESYALYSEDTDYCLRARKSGFDILFVPKAKVWHKISAATGGQFSWKKIKLRTASNFIFLRRHARWWHWLTIPFFQVIEVVRVMILLIRR